MMHTGARIVSIMSLVSAVHLYGCSSEDSGGSNTLEPGIMGFPTAGAASWVGTAGTGAEAAAGSVPGGGAFGAAGTTFGGAGIEGMAGVGAAGIDGSAGVDGMGMAGVGALAGMGGVAGEGAAGSGGVLMGTCCADGDCVCRDDAPSALTSGNGKYKTTTYNGTKGTIHYPTDAVAPFSAIAICGGFSNTGPEMASWGTFYASHGIVTIVTTTLGTDQPATRASKLLASIAELKAENTKSGGPLFGKLNGRYGTSGYSMGGGGTTIASEDDPTLLTSVGLAAWNPVGTGVQVPTLLLCGGADSTAPCSMSMSSYDDIPTTTPKMMINISGVSHLSWFGPTSAGGGTSGKYALAFQKVYLEGDERWKSLLLSTPSNGTMTTAIK
jgi:hypothetical protein